jgi:hypothetical protein
MTVVVSLVLYAWQWAPFWWVLPVGTVCEVSLVLGYYARVRPNLTLNRMFFMMVGYSGIGLPLFILEALALKPFVNVGAAPWPVAFALIIIPFAVGVYIGDWIGKRRNYQLHLPLTP